MVKNLNKVVISQLPLFLAITLIYGAIFGVAQQVLRQSAYDPQIQLAEDAGQALANGKDISTVIPTTIVDISSSLAPFVVAYDESFKPIVASGEMMGKPPQVPVGVLQNAKRKGENRISWQPAPNVRHAIVAVYFHGARNGYVLAGRSLRPTEERTMKILADVGIAWAMTLAATVVAAIGVRSLRLTR